jgi:hypothetical protein
MHRMAIQVYRLGSWADLAAGALALTVYGGEAVRGLFQGADD